MQKKKISQRLYEAIWPSPPKGHKRSYQAARSNRLNANWTTYPTGANYERRQDLAVLRARARQASRDDPHLSKFLSLMRSNVIGPKGIMLQSQARDMKGELNVLLNKRVEEAWWQWSHAETCTLSGKLNFKGVQDLAVTQFACDGEFLIEMVPGADNEFGFALKCWDVNWLDETYNENLRNGNRVLMSVEVDANDRPVAYWLTMPPTEHTFATLNQQRRERIRKPAENMIHGFLIHDDESQVRGVTAFKAVLLTAKNYHGYNEGVITSARVAANTFGFIKQDLADGEEYTGAENSEGQPTVPMIDSSPLSMNLLNPGQSFEGFDPKQPTQNHSAFTKTILMELAAGLGVPYFYLAGDMEAVNFSSSRVGLDDARDIWKGLQDFIATTLCRRVFHAWAYEAMYNGKLNIKAREFAEIQNPVWRARGWKYIDPTKDINADVERLKYKLATPSEILSEQGIDYVDHLERWQADAKLAKSYGIDINELYSEQPKQLAPAPAENDDDEADPPPKTERGYTNGRARLLS